jgi:hypothetical protein
VDTTQGTEEARQGEDGLAADFGADEDDFFSKVEVSAPDDIQDLPPAPLERKSTMQVMDDLGMGKAAADMATVEESLEEDERLEDAAHANDDAPQQEGVDLDAKWKEVFAGDDDEDFLLDDTSEENQVDPAAFFGDDDEGFLEDEDEPTVQPTAPGMSPVTATPAQPVKNRYLPTGQSIPASTPANPYLPSTPFAAQAPAPFAAAAAASVLWFTVRRTSATTGA